MASLAPTGTSDDDTLESFLDPGMADTARFPTSRPRSQLVAPEGSGVAPEDSGEAALDEDPDGPDTVRSPNQAPPA